MPAMGIHWEISVEEHINESILIHAWIAHTKTTEWRIWTFL